MASHHRRGFVEDFLRDTQKRGMLVFSWADIRAVTDQSDQALVKALRRASLAGKLVRPMPRVSFFVIVPPEYEDAGSPPVEWWLDDLMAHLRVTYCVSLWSGAAAHGSAHFATMATEVLADRRLAPIRIGRALITFHYNRHIDKAPVDIRPNTWASLRVAAPATVLVDLIRYQAGSPARIAQTADEMADLLTPEALRAALDYADVTAVGQRLGLIFDRLGRGELASEVKHWLEGRHVPRILLAAGNAENGEMDVAWNVVINSELEAGT